MSSIITYNGVQIVNAQTRRFEQQAVYDESDTDLVHHQFTIAVEGSVHIDPNARIGVYPFEFDPQTQQLQVASYGSTAALMQRIHAQLMHPRGTFLFAFSDGSVLLYVLGQQHAIDGNGNAAEPPVFGGAIAAFDVKNGPKPRSCNITHIAGGVYRVEFTIELHVIKCHDQQDYGPNFPGQTVDQNIAVLSNRWSLEESKDEHFYTSRTWDGVLRVRNSNYWPHMFRYMVVPPLLRGYRRIGQRFTQSADGLWLRWTVTDKQMHAAPPPPAVDWRATYSESLGAFGVTGFSSLHIRLVGAPGSSKRALVAAAFHVAHARLAGIDAEAAETENAQGEEVPGTSIIRDVTISHEEHANEVEMRMTVQRTPPDQETLYGLGRDRIGTPLELEGWPYDKDKWPTPSLYDAGSPAGLFATYLQTPCNPIHGTVGVIQQTPQETQPKESEQQAPEDAEYFESNDEEPPQDAGTLVSDAQRTSGYPYTFVEIDQRYVTRRGMAQLPLAREVHPQQDSTQVVTLHGPVCRRVMRVRAERVGDWPSIPQPERVRVDANQITETLFHDEVLPEAPELLPDGKRRIYRIQARYEYALSRPPTEEEKLRSGASPAQKGDAEDFLVDGRTAFDPGID